MPTKTKAKRTSASAGSKNGKSSKASAKKGPDKRQSSKASPSTTKRSVWKGAITFGLITIPVGLFSATEERDISFHMLSSKDGSRIRFKRVSSKSGREVDYDDIVRGYEYEKGKYVTFTDEELDQIPLESAKAIDVVQFVEREEIDPIYYEKTYYVGPEEAGLKAYKLLSTALERSGKVGIGKVTLREKERLCTLRSTDGVLVLETMNWPDEIRIPAFDELEKDPRISSKEVEMAEKLIDQLTEKFDPDEFRDEYRERLQEVIDKKIAGDEIEIVEDEVPDSSEVKDLMEALRASVEATKEKRKSA